MWKRCQGFGLKGLGNITPELKSEPLTARAGYDGMIVIRRIKKTKIDLNANRARTNTNTNLGRLEHEVPSSESRFERAPAAGCRARESQGMNLPLLSLAVAYAIRLTLVTRTLVDAGGIECRKPLANTAPETSRFNDYPGTAFIGASTRKPVKEHPGIVALQ